MSVHGIPGSLLGLKFSFTHHCALSISQLIISYEHILPMLRSLLTVGYSLQATSSLPSRAARLAAQRLRNGQDLLGGNARFTCVLVMGPVVVVYSLGAVEYSLLPVDFPHILHMTCLEIRFVMVAVKVHSCTFYSYDVYIHISCYLYLLVYTHVPNWPVVGNIMPN